MKAIVTGLVDIGKIRTKNDDRALIDHKIIESGIYQEELTYPFHCAICDGVGGALEGSKGAQFVLEKISDNKFEGIGDKDSLVLALSNINDELINYQKVNNIMGMQTTLVGLGLYEDRVILYNSGDSRLYRLREGVLSKLSQDHSVAQEKIINGEITVNIEEELMKCNRITRCFGLESVLPPYVRQINVAAIDEDIYMLCSDGLWGSVKSDVIEAILSNGNDSMKQVQELMEVAFANGSTDNISIIIIKIQ